MEKTWNRVFTPLFTAVGKGRKPRKLPFSFEFVGISLHPWLIYTRNNSSSHSPRKESSADGLGYETCSKAIDEVT